jgi:cell division protein FtsZ
MPEFVLEDEPAGFARIKVVGVGGGGCNAVDSMFDLGLQNVDFYVINSDLQALKRSKCPNRIQIGSELTLGRGCGADPNLGQRCMEDDKDLLIETLQGADIVFVTAGLGGGTGTGAAPVVARVAKELGILTVTVVTKPFKFEGPRRMKSAVAGLERLREASDTMIVINNERLLEVVGANVPMKQAFATADKVLSQATQSISDLVATPGLINVDFNDIRTIMGGRGGAVMGVGIGKGESRATEAVKKATSSPLLDKVVIDGATGVLICITGGPDMTLAEVSAATEMVAQAADPDAEIIFGAVIDETLNDSMRVTLIATGFSDELHRKREIEAALKSAPVAQSRYVNIPATPEPAPVVKAEKADSLDDIDSSPLFAAMDEVESEPVVEAPRPAPRAEAPQRPAGVRPAPQAAPAPAPRKSSLRTSLDDLMDDEGDDHRANGTVRPAPRAEMTGDTPPIRVARSVRSENGGHERPAVRPAETRRHVEEPAPSVPQYTPQADSRQPAEDHDTPAFLRKRRGLFE